MNKGEFDRYESTIRRAIRSKNRFEILHSTKIRLLHYANIEKNSDKGSEVDNEPILMAEKYLFKS